MKIHEVSERFQLSIPTLRYYEEIGLLGNIQRSENKTRIYTEKDIERLDFILCFKKAGLGLKQIKEYLDLCDEGDETLERRKEILEVQREYLIDQIDQLQTSLKRLEKKIDGYQNLILEKEK